MSTKVMAWTKNELRRSHVHKRGMAPSLSWYRTANRSGTLLHSAWYKPDTSIELVIVFGSTKLCNMSRYVHGLYYTLKSNSPCQIIRGTSMNVLISSNV